MNNYYCPVCGDELKTEIDIDVHKSACAEVCPEDDWRYYCPVCGDVIYGKNEINAHIDMCSSHED